MWRHAYNKMLVHRQVTEIQLYGIGIESADFIYLTAVLWIKPIAGHIGEAKYAGNNHKGISNRSGLPGKPVTV